MDNVTASDAGIAQILVSIGELKTQLAVLTVELKAIPDHEARIRGLERFRFTLGGLSLVGGAVAGWLGYVIGHALH